MKAVCLLGESSENICFGEKSTFGPVFVQNSLNPAYLQAVARVLFVLTRVTASAGYRVSNEHRVDKLTSALLVICFVGRTAPW
jgi:hypothetical protein